MQVDYKDYLPYEFRASAIRLYFTALKEKLEPILGSDGRVIKALENNTVTDKCLVAIFNGKLVGIMGIQTNKGGFLNPRFKTMVNIYGILGGIIRMGGLMILHHTTGTDELYIDGVAVAHEMRGKGIGSRLFDLLERSASKNKIRTISLEVIDTNPRAKALYEHLGFEVMKVQTLWPLSLFIKFPFRSSTLMIKKIGYCDKKTKGLL
ncbi:GNAT family N-acetyltransferase [Desulfobacterales bacterium HSG17]|nr:GNAT family N-acetyltransferase [Desulfobacterales bacterium HSG17]